MAKATHGLSPAVTLSKLDPADRTRATWRAAHAMARRMVRPGTRHGSGDLYAYFLAAGHRRFGDAAFPIVRAAAGCALARLHLSRAATGTPAELARQGMLSRAVRLDPAPFGGWTWAWTHDTLERTA
jgi:hypothetical protein